MTDSVRLKWLLTESEARAGAQAEALPLLSVSISWGVRRREASDTTTRAASEDLANYKLCRAGDLVINRMRAFQGALGIAPEDGVVSPDYAVLQVDLKVDKRWLNYILTSGIIVATMTSLVRGIGGTEVGNVRTPRLNISDLRSMTVPLVSADEQRAIADYLDRETARIDTLIEEQQRLITMLRERRDGIVTQTFLNLTKGESALRFAVHDVTVGIVVQPSRWYVDDGVPALRGVDVKRGSISRADLVNISEEGHAAHLKSQLRSGDVVVVRTGQAGAAAKVPDELDGANAIDILIVRPGESTDSDFLVWYLNSPLAASRIEHGSVGALQGHFNVSALRGLPFPRVSVAEQQLTVAYLEEQVAKIDTTIAETDLFVELVRERRAALITAAVTGQIDVRKMA